MIDSLPLILLVGIIFLAVGLGGALARRLGQSVIPAYILVGVMLGPGIPQSLGPVPLSIVQSTEFIDCSRSSGS